MDQITQIAKECRDNNIDPPCLNFLQFQIRYLTHFANLKTSVKLRNGVTHQTVFSLFCLIERLGLSESEANDLLTTMNEIVGEDKKANGLEAVKGLRLPLSSDSIYKASTKCMDELYIRISTTYELHPAIFGTYLDPRSCKKTPLKYVECASLSLLEQIAISILQTPCKHIRLQANKL